MERRSSAESYRNSGVGVKKNKKFLTLDFQAWNARLTKIELQGGNINAWPLMR
jgi:hypothetical protein